MISGVAGLAGARFPRREAEREVSSCRITMIRAKESSLADVLPWRDLHCQEMSCQITKDSIHSRPGWTREYLLRDGSTTVGYGSVAVAGPWKDKPTIYEFHVAPPARGRVFELFEALLAASGAVA